MKAKFQQAQRIGLLALSVWLLSLSSTYGQDKRELLTAIGSGDIESIGQYVDESVEICLLDEHDIYDKDEAMALIKAFFEENIPSGFSKKHTGDNRRKSSSYVIGSLSTENGPYRLFVYTDTRDDRLILEELRISRREY